MLMKLNNHTETPGSFVHNEDLRPKRVD